MKQLVGGFTNRGQKREIGNEKGSARNQPRFEAKWRGCVECLASPKGWWFHLRRCAECGHIGCCDSSPSQHASKHAAATGHPIIASFEPGKIGSRLQKQGMIRGVELLPPHSHPTNQPTPGPAGRVPADWESLLH